MAHIKFMRSQLYSEAAIPGDVHLQRRYCANPDCKRPIPDDRNERAVYCSKACQKRHYARRK